MQQSYKSMRGVGGGERDLFGLIAAAAAASFSKTIQVRFSKAPKRPVPKSLAHSNAC